MEREIHIRISIDRNTAIWMMVGLLLSMSAADIGSETVTLQTYYPAPYGIYTKMRTTDQTTLAETNGKVGIGTTAPDANYKFDVRGGRTYLDAGLSVSGGASIGSGYVTVAAPTNGMIVQGRVGIGTSSPDATYDLEVVGKARFTKYIRIGQDGVLTGCVEKTVAAALGPGGNTPCDTNQYATWLPGIYSEGMSSQPRQAVPDFGGYYAGLVWFKPAGGVTPYGGRPWHFDSVGVKFYCCPK